MDPDGVGTKGDDPVDCSSEKLRAVPGKPRHEVDPRCKVPFLEPGHCAQGVGRPVSALRKPQDIVVERLRPDFDRLYPEGLEHVETRRVDFIGTCGDTDVIYRTFPQIRRREPEQVQLFLAGHAGKCPPVKGNLDGTASAPAGLEIGADGLSKTGFLEPVRMVFRDQLLVAEEAAVGAAPVHDKDGDDHGLTVSVPPAGKGAISRRFSIAILAACCSASFLFLPVPVAMVFSPMRRLISKRLS